MAAETGGCESAIRSSAARAKVNLSLHVLGRRADGYHEIESLVVFAGCADTLTLAIGPETGLDVSGPTAASSGSHLDNLVLRAASELARLVPGLRSGHFSLEKSLPVAAGLGGGSADAAAALRLLGAANGLPPDDPRLFDAAQRTGADVPVCLRSVACLMGGIGERLGPALAMPALPAILVNPRVPVATAAVFKALNLEPGSRVGHRAQPAADGPDAMRCGYGKTLPALFANLAAARNDLQAAAIAVAPVIAGVLTRLDRLDGAKLARMSGSGASCFVLFETIDAAKAGAAVLMREQPDWWVEATMFG